MHSFSVLTMLFLFPQWARDPLYHLHLGAVSPSIKPPEHLSLQVTYFHPFYRLYKNVNFLIISATSTSFYIFHIVRDCASKLSTKQYMLNTKFHQLPPLLPTPYVLYPELSCLFFWANSPNSFCFSLL